MEKFTLFDLLGLLLPGVLFVFISKELLDLYDLIPKEFNFTKETSLTELGVWLVISIIFGAGLFRLSDLLKRSFLYVKVLGIYKPIGKIFFSMRSAEPTFLSPLNKQSRLWFNENIFLTKQDFNELKKHEQINLINKHDRFYAKAYYELQYEDKIDYPKAYQSFYFFFRQLTTGFIILIPIIFAFQWNSYLSSVNYLLTFCGTLILISVILARYYRSEMVKKLYIIYSIHLNKISHEKNQGNS